MGDSDSDEEFALFPLLKAAGEAAEEGDVDDGPESITVTNEDGDEFSIFTQSFHDDLEALGKAAKAIDTLGSDLSAIRQTNLKDEDVVALLYGRNSGLNKGDIEAVMGAMDEVAESRSSMERKDDLLVRLLSDVGNVTQANAKAVMGEVRRVGVLYGEEDG